MAKSVNLFETQLLKVSQPYGILVGDTVRNINPSCQHYRSVGKVVGVDLDGNISYKVNNQGATYKPGDVLVKSAEQLLKVFTHTPRPGYGMFSNE
jgi:hypothetical protein